MHMGARDVTVVVVVTTVVVVVAGANENWPMVACESRDFGRLRALWPWVLEAMLGSGRVLVTCEGLDALVSRSFVCRPFVGGCTYGSMVSLPPRMYSKTMSCRGDRGARASVPGARTRERSGSLRRLGHVANVVSQGVNNRDEVASRGRVRVGLDCGSLTREQPERRRDAPAGQ